MNAAQQSALEALAGRPLNATELALGANRSNDGALAASLAAGLPPVVGSVPSSVFLAWTVQNKMRGVIQDKAAAAGDPLRDSALALLDLIASRIDLDLSDGAVGQGNLSTLAAWKAAGLITAAQQAALIALASSAAVIPIGVVSDILNGA